MFISSGTARQIYATLCSNLLSVSYGTTIGWASTSLPFLESNETVLSNGPLTKDGEKLALSYCHELRKFILFLD